MSFPVAFSPQAGCALQFYLDLCEWYGHWLHYRTDFLGFCWRRDDISALPQAFAPAAEFSTGLWKSAPTPAPIAAGLHYRQTAGPGWRSCSQASAPVNPTPGIYFYLSYLALQKLGWFPDWHLGLSQATLLTQCCTRPHGASSRSRGCNEQSRLLPTTNQGDVPLFP